MSWDWVEVTKGNSASCNCNFLVLLKWHKKWDHLWYFYFPTFWGILILVSFWNIFFICKNLICWVVHPYYYLLTKPERWGFFLGGGYGATIVSHLYKFSFSSVLFYLLFSPSKQSKIGKQKLDTKRNQATANKTRSAKKIL